MTEPPRERAGADAGAAGAWRRRVPLLPFVDLLLLMGWTSLMMGAVLKAVYVTTSYRPTLLGLTPMDLF